MSAPTLRNALVLTDDRRSSFVSKVIDGQGVFVVTYEHCVSTVYSEQETGVFRRAEEQWNSLGRAGCMQ